MAETLFSLEVHVESVEELRVPCKLPALCFRLLDFPTMIIHHVSPLDAEKIRQRLRMDGKESLLHELRDRFGNFQFRKGKSCLFKASIDTLLVQLQTVPLYAMLMDLWPKKPTLVGSTLIPLKKAIDKISADVYDKGVAVPAFYRDEGDFSVYNLMGSSIAKVKLGFRLLSLGGSLIPHIPTESLGKRISEKVETSEKVEQAVKGALQKVLPEIESRNERLNTEDEYNHENVAAIQRANIQHVEVQTNLHAVNKSSRTLDRQRKDSEEDVVITNTFCPPPLYYNYFSNPTPHERPNGVTTGEGIESSSNNDMRYREAVGQDDTSDVDFVYYDPHVIQTDGTVGVTSVSVQTDEKVLKPSTGPQSSSHQADELINGLHNLKGVTSDGHLPILNALLQELSCLTGGQQSRDTSQPRSLSARSQATPRRPQTVGSRKQAAADTRLRKTETSNKKQTSQGPHSKRSQTSVIGLPRQRVRFKQTSLSYGMTRTQKMRLEINQKDKLPDRTRSCELQQALAQKENIKRHPKQMPLSMGDLGMTYKIDTTKRQKGKEVQKQTADVLVQTQQLSTEKPHHEKGGLPGTTEVTKEITAKPDAIITQTTVESAGSFKSQNSLEIFIPQVEGELDERSDQEREWTMDQPPLGIYGNTGIISAEPDDIRGGSAMTMYTEDFEDSGTDASQASYHLAFTRSNSADNENLKQRSSPDESSASTHSQGSSKASGRPVKSSYSPVKANSRRSKAKIEEKARVQQKIATSDEDFEPSADQAKSLSGSSKDQKEGSDGSYSEDFHSVGSEPQNRNSDATSDDSIDDNDQHNVLDLPPPASNLGYTC